MECIACISVIVFKVIRRDSMRHVRHHIIENCMKMRDKKENEKRIKRALVRRLRSLLSYYLKNYG
jgi:hypothetical protein